MKKILLTAAMLIAGMISFNSCEEEDLIEPNEIPDKIVDDRIDEEAAPEKLDPILTGDNGTGCFSPSFFDGGLFGMGRSFNINYPDKSVKRCFTTKSRDQKEILVEKGTGTEYKVYYTKNDYEYNSLETNKFSGGASYLNIIALDGYVQESVKKSTMQSTERLVFIATKDFGKFEYPNDLLLTQEAYAYLKDGKFDAFKENYGTHYIYGCEKMATIMVVIESNTHSSSFETENSDGIGISASYRGAKGYVEYDESTNHFSLDRSQEVKVYAKVTDGVSISTKDIEQTVMNEIEWGSTSYVKAVEKYLEEVVNRLTVDQSVNYKYYAMPFSKLGCEGINWTKKKENKLITINENYLTVQRVINMVSDYTKKNTADVIFLSMMKDDIFFQPQFYTNLLDYCNAKFSNVDEELKKEMVDMYSSANLETEWSNLKNKAKALSNQLESQYDKCNDVTYNVASSDEDYSDDVESLIDEFNLLYKKGYDVANNMIWIYMLASAAEESKNLGTITLKNTSSCNFSVEISGPKGYYDSFRITGNSSVSVKVSAGSYTIHTLQLDGYNTIFGWPTEDSETISVQAGNTTTYSFNDHW